MTDEDRRRPTGQKAYPVAGRGVREPPKYDRVAKLLSDAELADEIARGAGEQAYRDALAAELQRRRDA